MLRSKARFACLATAGLLCAGCGDTPAAVDDPIASLEVSGDSLIVAGESRSFATVARTVSGRTVTVTPVTWSVLDSTVAAVDGAGWVTGLRPGETAVVAHMESFGDTAHVRVYWGDVALGDVRGMIEGDARAYFRWSGLAKVSDVLATVDGDRTTVHASQPDATHRDSSVTIVLPSVLSPGEYAIGSYPLDGALLTAPSALVALGEAGVDLRVYYSVGGTLTVDDATYPDRPGLLSGSTTGTFRFRATRYSVGPDGQPVASGDTVTVNGELHLGLQHLLRASVNVSVDGGPVPGTSVSAIGQASNEPSGFLIWWDVDMDGVYPHPFPWELSHSALIRSPAAGTFALADIDPATLADPEQWPAAYSELYYRDSPVYGLSDAGTLTITRWIEPTDAAYGEIHGTLDAALELWDADTSTGQTMRATATFAIPINPRGGVPN